MISLKKARKTIPDASDLKLAKTLGYLLYRKGSYSEAVKELASARKLKIADSNNSFYLRMCYFQLGRYKVVKQLLLLLLPRIRRIENDRYQSHNIDMLVDSMKKQESTNYYVWLDLHNEVVRLEKVREVFDRGKKIGCSRYLLISTDIFEDSVEQFKEVRPIETVEGPALREKLLKVP